MTRLFSQRRRRPSRRGILSFEWILLISILVIGIIGGLAAVRNALLSELNDLSQAVEAINVCGTCDPASCPPGNPDCCDDPWWCCGP
ncbi:MAG: hypothetical protein WBH86_03260 [Thermogutta sp.]|nr:hypothetical protein [Thermogutta sp.]HOP76168.1 hypothetical protein [Thermogutta sp.]HPU05815.1 hypothetical protein [Thermogutta sp.]HPZ82753.1 hypothetical protein [Thermogutta sp.]HQF12466.1 hypothetical protein [Thermogutta sp.]